MAEQSKESSMEEILSSIKRIIAEDKATDSNAAPVRKTIAKPKLKAVPDVEVVEEEEVLELTEEVQDEDFSSAQGVFGDRRRDARLIDENKLDAMRESLSALVSAEGTERKLASNHSNGTSLEDMTREMMRPMLKQWLDDNLPQLVEELVSREIARINKN
ncbi:MAG: DUF2497 domain-containing protein [Parasphingorhabdus sp.]